MRLFVSINWDDETLAFIQAWQKHLQQDNQLKGYWRKISNLHLTLKFIGEVKENRISDIRRALENVCPSLNPFEVTFKNLGVFPNMKMPRILWMGVESRELLSLQEAIETQLCAIEIPKEDRRYQPHITLASGRIEGMNNAVLWEGQSIDHKAKVMSFELMQSTVEQDGRKYRSIAEYIFTNRIGNDRV